MYEYIKLTSVDSSRNRNRAYALTVTTSPSDDNIYVVRQSWGRGDFYRNQMLVYFQDFADVETYLRSLLTRRQTNGYSVCSVSECFPEVMPLAYLVPTCGVVQLSLFGVAA